MARRKKMKLGDVIGGIVALIMIGAIITYPWLIVGALVGLGVWGYLKSRPCDICGNQIKRSAYTWKIDGKKKRVCPHCNQRLEREQSRKAFNNL